MTPIRRVNAGKRLSDATVHNGVAYLAGQVPEDASLPIREQTRSVLDQIDRLLAGLGSDKTHILSATIYLASIGDFNAMNEAYVTFFPKDPPTRSTVQVSALASPTAKVEIECMFAMPGGGMK